MICFAAIKHGPLGELEEWKFFLEDLEQASTSRGHVLAQFNREDDGSHYSEESGRFFVERGAEVEEQRVMFLSSLPGFGLTNQSPQAGESLLHRRKLRRGQSNQSSKASAP